MTRAGATHGVTEESGFDTISVDPAAGLCTLTITDHLAWNSQHLSVLQARINQCLRIIESGELYLFHPSSLHCDFAIELRFIYAPDQRAAIFLEEARRILHDAGYLLRFGPLGSSYADDGNEVQ